MRKLTLLLAAAGMGLACQNVGSGDVSTDAVYADLRVTADGGGSSVVYAALKVGGSTSNTFVDLTEYDALLAYQDATSAVMARNEALGKVWYESIFAIEAADAPFQVSFLRTPNDEEDCSGASAPNSNVTMAAPYGITAPVSGANHSRATDDVTVTWDPSGTADSMGYLVTGNCIELRAAAITGDPGTITIPANDFVALQGQESTSCSVDITITRERGGTLDPNYGEGGSIVSRQVRQIDILSAP